MSLAIEAHNLTKKYRNQKENHQAVQDLNLAIRQGDVMTIEMLPHQIELICDPLE